MVVVLQQQETMIHAGGHKQFISSFLGGLPIFFSFLVALVNLREMIGSGEYEV
jgi:hypothetical protein